MIRIKNLEFRIMGFLLFALFIIHYSLFIPNAYAQGLDLANVYDVTDNDAKDGDIIVFDPSSGLKRSAAAYDIQIFGVLQDQTALSIRRTDGTGRAIARSGITKVNVSLTNGPIKKGDYITTSTLPGLGMKANLSGNVIGIALEDSKENSKYNQACITNPSGCAKDQISIAVNPEYAELSNPRSTNRLFELIGTAFFRNTQDPQGFGKIIKNVVAGFIMLFCMMFGLFTIARAVPKAVEAIGRNPLARRSIQLSLALNILVVGFVVVGGIVAAFIVLRL